jgi:membrane protein
VSSLRRNLEFLQRILREFVDDDCPVRAAALAYYAVFALPAVVVLLIVIAGTIWSPADVQRAMNSQLGLLVGSEVGRTIQYVMERAERPGNGSLVATVIGILALLFSATGALGQLQAALNNAWQVKPDPRQGGVKGFIAKRLISSLLILGLALLLIASLGVSAVLGAIGDRVPFVPEGVLHLADLLTSFAILTVVFAGVYRVLPDAEVAWRDVWLGAVVATALLVSGKFAIGMYLGRSAPGSAYGAAGALAGVLVWSYFAAMTVLLGAEVTQVWATRRGRLIRPEPGAVRAPRDQRVENDHSSEKVESVAPVSEVAPIAGVPLDRRATRGLTRSIRRYPRGASIAVAMVGWWLLRHRR